MSVTAKIGFLPGFNRMPIETTTRAFLFFLFVTVGMMVLLGLIGESRLIPLSPRHQFLGFFPGDIFLSLALAMGVRICMMMPEGHHWFRQWEFQVAFFLIAVRFSMFMAENEVATGIHTAAQMRTPVARYHTYGLYGLLGYVAIAIVVAVLFGSDWKSVEVWKTFGLSLVFLACYAGFVAYDGGREFDSSKTYVENPRSIFSTVLSLIRS